MTHHKSIDVNNRAQLIDDALSLARAELMDYSQALEITKYLVYERNYAPWKAALTKLQYIGKMLIKSGGYGAFKVTRTSCLDYGYEDNRFFISLQRSICDTFETHSSFQLYISHPV
jgi:hypothetical protein